jgi:hypothetical protein
MSPGLSNYTRKSKPNDGDKTPKSDISDYQGERKSDNGNEEEN